MTDCGKCKVKFKRGETSQRCSGLCNGTYHFQCIGVDQENGELLNKARSVRGIRWFCEYCEEQLNVIFKLSKEIDEFKNMVKQQLDEFKNVIHTKTLQEYDEVQHNKNKKSYAQVMGEVLIIKPKVAQESKKTVEAVKKVVNPSELKIGIAQIKDVKDGGVLIRCKTKEEIEKIKSAVDKKLKIGYQTNVPEQKNPRIKIVDIDENLTKEELEMLVPNQNPRFVHENAMFKVLVVKKMKTKYMCIAECDPETLDIIMSCEEKRVFINYSYCRVFEHFPMLRCYKCGEYNHKIEDCKNEIDQCLICLSSEHETKSCNRSQKSCIHCLRSNEKYGTRYNTNHTIFYYNCPIYLEKIEIQRQKIKTFT